MSPSKVSSEILGRERGHVLHRGLDPPTAGRGATNLVENAETCLALARPRASRQPPKDWIIAVGTRARIPVLGGAGLPIKGVYVAVALVTFAASTRASVSGFNTFDDGLPGRPPG